MGNPYTSQTISGYNASPPADDGSQVASNQVTWAKHKTKLGDPVKNLSESINTEVLSAFGKLPWYDANAQSTNYTIVAGDERKIISCTNSITITLLAAATAGDGFTVTIFNAGTGTITIDGATSETINGATSITLTSQYQSAHLFCDGTAWFNVADSNAGSSVTLGTPQATTSGSTKTFSGIPSGTKLIIFSFDGVSTDGTAGAGVRIGDSGGIETTGYVSASQESGSATIASSTAEFILISPSIAARAYHGHMILALMDSSNNTWSASVQFSETTGPEVWHGSGTKSLSAELTQIDITCSPDAFDAGSVNISYL